jgi:hypothetical protein
MGKTKWLVLYLLAVVGVLVIFALVPGIPQLIFTRLQDEFEARGVEWLEKLPLLLSLLGAALLFTETMLIVWQYPRKRAVGIEVLILPLLVAVATYYFLGIYSLIPAMVLPAIWLIWLSIEDGKKNVL